MPKPEWGVKRVCGACGTRFYDLGKEEVECPNCGTPWVSTIAMAERAKASKATANAEPDEDVVDDEDELETADEVDVLDDDDDGDDSDDVVLDDDGDDDDEDDIGDDVLLDDDDDDDDLGDYASVPDEPKET